MNLQNALIETKTINTETECLIHICKRQHIYEVMALHYDHEEQRYVSLYSAGSLIADDGEGDVYSGDTESQIIEDIATHHNVEALAFYRVSKSASVICEDELIIYVLHALFEENLPDPQQLTDWSEYSTLVDQQIQRLKSASASSQP